MPFLNKSLSHDSQASDKYLYDANIYFSIQVESDISTRQNTFGQLAAAKEVSREFQVLRSLGPSRAFSVLLDASHQLHVIASDDSDLVVVTQVVHAVAHAVLRHQLVLTTK